MDDPVEQMFAPFALRITCGPLSMRCMRDHDVPEMTAAIRAHGIYDDGRVMPFLDPWVDRLGEHGLPTAQYYWGLFAQWSPQRWQLPLRVEHEGVFVGCQGIGASSPLATLGTVSTGSWLLRNQQGRGIGTLMRQAVCAFAFDELGASEMTSGAVEGNTRSDGVSRRVGYARNGTQRVVGADGVARTENRYRLTPQTFVRPPYPVVATGVEAFVASITA